MGLADRFARPGEPAPAATSPSEITCPRYDPVPGTKRCKHYLKGGACALPDEFMCVEWLKANGHHVPPPLPPLDPVEATPSSEPAPAPAQPSSTPPPPRPDRTERDLFGAPVRPRPATRSSREPEPASSERSRPEPDPRDVPVVRNLSDEDIASFKALNVEVCLATEDCGQIWLVPETTERFSAWTAEAVAPFSEFHPSTPTRQALADAAWRARTDRPTPSAWHLVAAEDWRL